jgi:hypothetical protein
VTMQLISPAIRVFVTIGDKEVEKWGVGYDPDADQIEVLRLPVSEISEGTTYFPPGAARDVYGPGQWRAKALSDPTELLQQHLKEGEEFRKSVGHSSGDEPRQGWQALFRIRSRRLDREIRGGELMCYQCVHQAFDDPIPRAIQPADEVAVGSQCALCGAQLRSARS